MTVLCCGHPLPEGASCSHPVSPGGSRCAAGHPNRHPGGAPAGSKTSLRIQAEATAGALEEAPVPAGTVAERGRALLLSRHLDQLAASPSVLKTPQLRRLLNRSAEQVGHSNPDLAAELRMVAQRPSKYRTSAVASLAQRSARATEGVAGRAVEPDEWPALLGHKVLVENRSHPTTHDLGAGPVTYTAAAVVQNGRLGAVDDESLTLSFRTGNVRIPRTAVVSVRDLNDVVPRGRAGLIDSRDRFFGGVYPVDQEYA